MRRINENSQIVRPVQINRVNDVQVIARTAFTVSDTRVDSGSHRGLRGSQLLRGKLRLGGLFALGNDGNMAALLAENGNRTHDTWQRLCHGSFAIPSPATFAGVTMTQNQLVTYQPQASATLK